MVTGPSAYGWPKSMTLAVLSAKSRLPPKLARYSDSTLLVSDLLLSSLIKFRRMEDFYTTGEKLIFVGIIPQKKGALSIHAWLEIY